MITQKKKKYILSKTKNLNKEITDIYNKYFKELSNLINQQYQGKGITTQDYIETLYNKIYDMLGEVYSLTSQEIKNIYSLKQRLPLSRIEAYSKDGYDLMARIQRWFDGRDKNNNDYIKTADEAIEKLKQILTTECLYQKQVVMNDKLKGFCEFAIIEESPDCHSGICNEYAGEWPINELIYPPYHPNCQCEVIYEISDDIEDVEDLDLEDDLDEEYYE